MTLTERVESKAETETQGLGSYPRVITVRLPPELHRRIRQIAHENHVSMNSLCIASLEHVVEQFAAPVNSNAAIASQGLLLRGIGTGRESGTSGLDERPRTRRRGAGVGIERIRGCPRWKRGTERIGQPGRAWSRPRGPDKGVLKCSRFHGSQDSG